jgi:surfactin synthase thioesterase subunit
MKTTKFEIKVLLVSNELERTWKEALMGRFEVLFRQLPGRTKETQESPKRIDLLVEI